MIREARDRANQIVDQASRRSNEIVEAGEAARAVAEGDRLIAAAKQQTELEATKAREELRAKWPT